MKSIRVMALAVISVLALGTAGCSVAGESAQIRALRDLPLVDGLSQSEIKKYYEDEVKYSAKTARTVSTNDDNVVFREVDSATLAKLELEIDRVTRIFNKPEYTQDMYVTQKMYNYIRSHIDDKILEGTKVTRSGASQEYYIVDITYDVTNKGAATMLPEAAYLGVHGAFRSDKFGNMVLDTKYIALLEKTITEKIDEQQKETTSGKRALADLIKQQKVSEGAVVSDEEVDVVDTAQEFKEDERDRRGREIDGATAIGAEEEETAEAEEVDLDAESAEPEEESEEPAEPKKKEDKVPQAISETAIDPRMVEGVGISVYNNVLGASLSQVAVVPDLSLILLPSASEGNISGNGIFVQASGDLKKFGISTDSTVGSCTIRYVFKGDLINPENITFQNAYIMSFTMSGVPAFDTLDIFPQFVETSIAQAVERLDRVRLNNDIAGMLDGNVLTDYRMAVLFGYINNYTIFHNFSSEIAQCVRREGNNWLVKVETVTNEEIEGNTSGPGTYLDTYYMVFYQSGDIFKLSDMMLVERQCIVEPALDYETANTRRFIAMSMSGGVSAENKAAVRYMVDKIYGYLTAKDAAGLHSMFESDESILPLADKLTLTSQLVHSVTRRGRDKDVEYIGAVTEWLSGAENQCEFMTVEMCNYIGVGTAQVTVNYYLASNYSGEWVVDEMKNIELYDVNGEDEIEKQRQEILGYKQGAEQAAIEAEERALDDVAIAQ